MAKITLSSIASFVSDVAARLVYTQNNDLIEAALENTLSRDGTTPNTMSDDLDMNSNKILNHPEPTVSTDLATKNYGDTNWGAASATAAAASAVIAAAKAALTALDVITTAADVVITNADVVLTNADVVSTNADVVSTNADVSTSGASASAASASESAASVSASNASTSETNADADAVSTAADVVSTGNDVTSTNADVVSTGNDVTSTNADVVTTNADVVSADAAAVSAQAADGFRFTFDSSTSMADPGTGDFRLNHATVGSATAIALSATSADAGNPDISDFITTWDDSTNTALRGTLVLRKVGTPATYAVFSVSGAVTDNTGWLQVAVTHVQSNGSWSASDVAVIRFNRTGDKGTDGAGTGDVVGPASSTDSTLAVFDGTTGVLLKDGGPANADVVLGPGSVTDGAVTLFDGTGGKLLKEGADPTTLVVGPASSTDNSIARYDSTTGKILLDSGVSVDDTDNLFGHGSAQNVQTGASYTLTASDNGKVVILNRGTAITLTVPQTSTETLALGFQCVLIQLGAGQVTVAKEGSDTIASKDSNLALTGQYSMATVLKTTAGSPNAWFLGGDLA